MISLCVPSRGRPERFRQMWESALETAHGPLEVCAVVDADDPHRVDYPNMGQSGQYYLAPHGAVHSDLWNVAWQNASGDIAMLCADDLCFRTDGWDLAVTESFHRVPDGILHVWCNDGTEHTEVATHPFVSRRWIEAVGTFTPPYYPVWYADTWLLMLGMMVGRQVYLEDYVIEHQHFQYGTAADDATYRRGVSARPEAQLEWASRAHEREEQARRLLAAMDRGVRLRPPLRALWKNWGYVVNEL